MRDLKLSKNGAELHASRMQQFGILAPGVKVTYYRNRSKGFAEYFTKVERICYCNNIEGLFNSFGDKYDSKEWRLFIDGSKYSLKAVLLHNGNKKPSISIAHATNTKESYEMKLIDYEQHNWKIFCDLKVVAMLIGLQGGYTKYCCFLYKWDSRTREHHYRQTNWPNRDDHIIGKGNVKNQPLVKKENVILSPLHIELGLMKNFVKALGPDSAAIQYLQAYFPKLSEGKVKEGIFVGPQICKLLTDDEFVNHLTANQAAAWDSFSDVVNGFLGNNRSRYFRTSIKKLLKNYNKIVKCSH